MEFAAAIDTGSISFTVLYLSIKKNNWSAQMKRRKETFLTKDIIIHKESTKTKPKKMRAKTEYFLSWIKQNTVQRSLKILVILVGALYSNSHLKDISFSLSSFFDFAFVFALFCFLYLFRSKLNFVSSLLIICAFQLSDMSNLLRFLRYLYGCISIFYIIFISIYNFIFHHLPIPSGGNIR